MKKDKKRDLEPVETQADEESQKIQFSHASEQGEQDKFAPNVELQNKFLHACEQDNLEQVQTLFNRMSFLDLNAQNENGYTPLHHASMKGKAAFQFLLSQGASTDLRTKNGETVLHFACKFGNLDLVKLLCEQKEVDVNVVTNIGHTPLYFASCAGKIEVVKYLLEERNAKADILTHNGNSNFLGACMQGHYLTVAYFYEREKDHLTDADIQRAFEIALKADIKDGLDYLCDIARVSLECKIKYLLENANAYSLDFSIDDKFVFYSLLSEEERDETVVQACKNSNKWFLNRIRKIVYSGYKSISTEFFPILYQFSDVECVKLFVNPLNLPYNPEKSIMTYFHYACMNPDVRVVKYLCETITGVTGIRTGFLIACAVGCRDVVKYLCEGMQQKPEIMALYAASTQRNHAVLDYFHQFMLDSINLVATSEQRKLEALQHLHQLMQVANSIALSAASEQGKLEAMQYLNQLMAVGDRITLNAASGQERLKSMQYHYQLMEDSTHGSTNQDGPALHPAYDNSQLENKVTNEDMSTRKRDANSQQLGDELKNKQTTKQSKFMFYPKNHPSFDADDEFDERSSDSLSL